MTTDDRSRDVFEPVPGQRQPPLPPLPRIDDYAALQRHGMVEVTPRSRKILDVALRAVGYPAFHARLPADVEHVLRTTNMRESKVFGPAYSATVALVDDPRSPSAVQRAATLVVAARSLCHDVMTGQLPPDELRGEPLEMGQYPNLFSTSVIVEGGRPRLHKSKRFDQLAVVVRRRVFTMHVGAVGELSVSQLCAALDEIVARATAEPAVGDDEAPGAVSAGDSKTITRALTIMERSPVNARSLAALRESFVVLCLDLDACPSTAADAAFAVHAANPANRWYLASLQLVVFGNGKAGGICSFPAYLDGNVMMRGAAELQRRACAAPLDGGVTGAIPAGVRELTWELEHRFVRDAWRDVRAIQENQRATFEISGVGRSSFEALGIDPVNSFVVALAMATKRSAGTLPNILQLVTVSRFRCVPVGGAVVTTSELRAFVEYMENPGRDPSRARSLLAECLASQARECRAERQQLSLRWTIEAFLRTRRGAARVRSNVVMIATAAALAAAGALPRDRIILSHPEIFPEVALLGRPGVRLPYVSHYGLHYQMFPERIVLTVMPGKKWRVRNEPFVHALEAALREVIALGPRAPAVASSPASSA